MVVRVSHHTYLEKDDRFSRHVREQPAFMSSLKKVDAGGGILVHQLNDASRPLAVIAPEAVLTSRLRPVTTKMQTPDHIRRKRRMIQQMPIHRFRESGSDRPHLAHSRITLDDGLQFTGPDRINSLDGKCESGMDGGQRTCF